MTGGGTGRGGDTGERGTEENNSRGGRRECSQSGNSLFISQKYILSCTIWFTHMYIFTICTKTTTKKKKSKHLILTGLPKNLTNSANPDDSTEAGIFFFLFSFNIRTCLQVVTIQRFFFFLQSLQQQKKINYDDDNADRTIAASSWFWGLEKNDTEKKIYLIGFLVKSGWYNIFNCR